MIDGELPSYGSRPIGLGAPSSRWRVYSALSADARRRQRPPAGPAPSVAVTPTVPVEVRKPLPAAPEVASAQAKAQAQKLAIEAIDQLQNGELASANRTLEHALALDTSNDLAKKLAGSRAPETAEAPAKPIAETESAPQTEVSALMQKGMQLQRSGNLEGAYAAFSEATQKDRGNRAAITQRDAMREALIRRYDREAVQAFQRQNLDVAIARWTSVLELDPANQKARLERERAADLKKRMTEKFGTK